LVSLEAGGLAGVTGAKRLRVLLRRAGSPDHGWPVFGAACDGRSALVASGSSVMISVPHGLRDGGELELTTPITNEFNPPPPAVRSGRSGTGLRRKCLYPDPAARTPATCGRVPGGPPGH